MSKYKIDLHQSKKYLLPKLMVKQFEGNDDELAAFNFAIKQIDYVMAGSFCEQIGVLCSHLRKPPLRVSYERIGNLFDESRHLIWDMEKNYLRGPGIDGRPLTLNEEELQTLKEYLDCLMFNPAFPIYPTFPEIADLICEKFHKYVSLDTLRHIVYNKYSKYYKTCIGKPMDANRIEANLNEIETNLYELSQKVYGVPASFVFNLDEMGQADYADSQETTVLVPISYTQPTAMYPIDRTSKRATCLACISPNGIGCIPQYCITRATIESDLYKYVPHESLQVVHTDTGFVNTASFLHWMNTCFLPNLRSLRQKYNYFGRAVLIMDGYKSHDNAISQINLVRENLVIHYLTAHTSDQSQPLDLGIFGCMKRYESSFKNIPGLSTSANQIIKIHKSFYEAANPINCRSAFREMGIVTFLNFNLFNSIERTYFDLKEVKKIRFYEESFLNQLYESKMPMTNNQIILFQYYQKKNQKQTKNKTQTVKLSYFPSPDRKKK